MREIYNIWSFIKRPYYEAEQENIAIIQNGIYLIKGFFIYYLLAFFITIFLVLLGHFGLIPHRIQIINNMPLSFYLLVLIPIKEECVFRLFLKFSKINVAISLSVLVFFIFFKRINIGIIRSIIIAILTFSFSYSLCNIYFNKLLRFWKKNIKYLYYGSSIIFGLLHISNFTDIKMIHLLFIPIIVANQIILGFILGYYRLTVKNGIILSILLHLFINLPPLLATHF